MQQKHQEVEKVDQDLHVLLIRNLDDKPSDSLLATLLQEDRWYFGVLLIRHCLKLFDAVNEKFFVGWAAVLLPLEHGLYYFHVQLPEVLILDLGFALDFQDEHEQVENFDELSLTLSESILDRLEDTSLFRLLKVYGSEHVDSLENMGVVDKPWLMANLDGLRDI